MGFVVFFQLFASSPILAKKICSDLSPIKYFSVYGLLFTYFSCHLRENKILYFLYNLNVYRELNSLARQKENKFLSAVDWRVQFARMAEI